MNRVRIHNDEGKKTERSLFLDVNRNETMLMEDWAIWVWITFMELPKYVSEMTRSFFEWQDMVWGLLQAL